MSNASLNIEYTRMTAHSHTLHPQKRHGGIHNVRINFGTSLAPCTTHSICLEDGRVGKFTTTQIHARKKPRPKGRAGGGARQAYPQQKQTPQNVRTFKKENVKPSSQDPYPPLLRNYGRETLIRVCQPSLHLEGVSHQVMIS